MAGNQASRRSLTGAFLFLPFFLPLTVLSADIPNFSGVWKLDALNSRQSGSGYHEFVITQTPDVVRIESNGQRLTYKLNGEETIYDDESLGRIPGFVRKLTTQANWEGSRLVIRTGYFNETTDPKTGKAQVNKKGMFTRQVTFSLAAGGHAMTAETTGYRVTPPEMLHGLPYDQASDPIYKKFTEVFRKQG